MVWPWATRQKLGVSGRCQQGTVERWCPLAPKVSRLSIMAKQQHWPSQMGTRKRVCA